MSRLWSQYDPGAQSDDDDGELPLCTYGQEDEGDTDDGKTLRWLSQGYNSINNQTRYPTINGGSYKQPVKVTSVRKKTTCALISLRSSSEEAMSQASSQSSATSWAP